jgi:hypothetical protein
MIMNAISVKYKITKLTTMPSKISDWKSSKTEFSAVKPIVKPTIKNNEFTIKHIVAVITAHLFLVKIPIKANTIIAISKYILPPYMIV